MMCDVTVICALQHKVCVQQHQAPGIRLIDAGLGRACGSWGTVAVG